MKYLLRLTIIVGLALLAAGPIWGAPKDLKYPPLGKFDVPQPDKVTLDNGVTVYLLEDHALPRIDVSVIINRCGGYLEPPTKIGLADMMLEVMRTGGTSHMTGDQIDEELEAVGASVEASAGNVSSSAYADMLSDYADKVIGILADVLRNPVFDPDKIELAKTGQRSAISRRNDEAMSMAVREFQKLLYGSESAYARTAEYATIEAVTRGDMVKFHAMIVQPKNIQLGVVGDFKKDEMLTLLRKYFGDWKTEDFTVPPPPKVDYAFRPTVNYAPKTDIQQSSILIGHIGGVMGDPDYPATIVMNTILGGSFGSRLTTNVRAKKGLAYMAQGNYVFNFEYPGWFYAFAATKSGSTVEAIREMIKQIRSMQTDLPTPEEMRNAKDSWLNSYVFNFDTKRKILGRMMSYDYYGLPVDYLQQLKEAVEKITPQDIIAVAKRKLNPDNLQILVVGKAEEFDQPLSVFGQVNEIDITIPAPSQEAFTATDEQLACGMQMLAKAAAACGGVANYKKIKHMTSQAKMAINTPQGAFVLDVASVDVMPDKTAQTITTPMGKQAMVFDGTAGWMSAGGKSQAMAADQIGEQKKEIMRNSIWLFSHADAPDFKVACKGEEQFAGKTAVRLDFLAAAGDQFTMYLDPATSIPAGMKYMGMTMAGPGEVVTQYNEFKEFSGVKIPVKIAQDGGGMKMEIEIISATINGEYDASIFKKPDGI